MTDPTLPAPEPRRRRARSHDPQFDAALGLRIRAARVAAGMNQTDLGRAVGVSFQQVQKYENGRDRVSAGTLRAIAVVLRVPSAQLLDEDTPVPDGDTKLVRAAMALATDWQRIKDPEVRRRIAALVAEVATGEENGQDEG